VIAIFTGILAGVVHVLSGPDHLAAVAPFAVLHQERAWLTGLRWGLGHASGVVLVGFLSLLLRELLPVDLLSAWSERLVGIVLIGIGLWGVRKAFTTHLHAHEHIHDGKAHLHSHVHHHGHAPIEQSVHGHTHAAFAVGTLHGLAGSSHFLGVLPALAFPTRLQAGAYLLAYGIGTIGGMASFSSVLGWVTRRLDFGGTRAYRGLMLSFSLAALGVGCFWIFS
jgi:sulfite exporter TauE/SafE